MQTLELFFACAYVGALLDATESYSSTFYFAGVMFFTAGLLLYLLPLTHRPVSRRTQSEI